jgi:DNA repair photolyase
MNPSKKRTGKSELGYKFISLFEKMPGNIYCPRFYILHHAVGCHYRCLYCFLQNTLRGNTSPRWYDNLDVMVKEVKDWLTKTKEKSLLNTGELTDSFAVSTEYLKHVLPLFLDKELNKVGHVLAFLTKSVGGTHAVNTLLPPHVKPQDAPIRLGWSVNAASVSTRYEFNAAPSTTRLADAESAKKMGYNVRIRLDPIIPILGWEEEYDKITEKICKIKPDFVTLRTLRAQSNLMQWASRCHASGGKDNPFVEVGPLMVRDGDDNAYRIKPELRLIIYRRLGKILDKNGIPWGLCKETTQLLTQIDKLNHKCNCLP